MDIADAKSTHQLGDKHDLKGENSTKMKERLQLGSSESWGIDPVSWDGLYLSVLPVCGEYNASLYQQITSFYVI